MRGSSNTIECGYCGKTIEYLNARLSGSQGKLVCLNCNTVPSIPKPLVDPLYGLPMEDFTLPYVIPTPPRSNSKSNFLNQRLGQAFNPQIMNTPSPVRYRSPSPPLPNLQEIIHTKKLLSPLPQTSPHFSPVHRNSLTKTLEKPMEVIPIEEALAQFGLTGIESNLGKETPNEPINLDELVNNELKIIDFNNTTQPSSRAKSLSPRINYLLTNRNRSPQPSASSLLTDLNASCVHPSPHHDASNSDIDDPTPMNSTITLKGYVTDFHDCDNTHCKSATHHPARRKTLKTKAERTEMRNRISGFECSVEGCDKHFINTKSLWQHQDIVHRKIKPFKCTHEGCTYMASNSSNLTVHKHIHIGAKPFKCTYEGCTYMTSHSSHLTTHNRLHTGAKPFKCTHEGCIYMTSYSSNLTVHNRLHTGAKPFKCTYEGCTYMTSNSSHLTRHNRIHTGAKPYICNICGKGFIQPSNLTRHNHIHTGAKPFKCTHEGCTYMTSDSSNLTVHNRIHTGAKPYICNACGKGFTQHIDLKRHKRSQHPQ